MYKPNPKLKGSNLIDCTPQRGPCPGNCLDCYYNRDGDLWEPNVPSKSASQGRIVRMNALHDSNRQKILVVATAQKYKHKFFNTSIANFDFPAPVIYTANPQEEEPVEMDFLRLRDVDKLMFIRLRVSATNLIHVDKAIRTITGYSRIPVVLTFMAYYSKDMGDVTIPINGKDMWCYHNKIRHVNKYWCPTSAFKKFILERFRREYSQQVNMCGTYTSNWCKDCRNCESYYHLALKRLLT